MPMFGSIIVYRWCFLWCIAEYYFTVIAVIFRFYTVITAMDNCHRGERRDMVMLRYFTEPDEEWSPCKIVFLL